MAKRRSPAEWSKVISRLRRSGETQSSFCERQGLSLATLQYHLKKQRPTPPSEITPVGFVEVTSPSTKGTVEIELSLPSGAVLRVRG